MVERLLRAQPDSVASHVTDCSIIDRRDLMWLATDTGWAESKCSTICSGKLISGYMISYNVNRKYGIWNIYYRSVDVTDNVTALHLPVIKSNQYIDVIYYAVLLQRLTLIQAEIVFVSERCVVWLARFRYWQVFNVFFCHLYSTMYLFYSFARAQ